MKLQVKSRLRGAGLARRWQSDLCPFTLPDEVVEAHIIEDKRSFANADLDACLSHH